MKRIRGGDRGGGRDADSIIRVAEDAVDKQDGLLSSLDDRVLFRIEDALEGA
jgi:hypothetical protein